jgi:hypothetical protein
MFARITHMQILPQKLDAMHAALPEVSARLKAVPGLMECKTCWDDSGKGLVFALYDTQDHAEAATDKVRAVWGALVPLLAAPPSSQSGTEVVDLLA